MSTHLLFVNGSLRGAGGNTHALWEHVQTRLPPGVTTSALVLADYAGTVEELVETLSRADAFLFASGVYWGSWGSPLQRFLEVLTAYELGPCFLGKPAAAAISADSVGGLDVAQRLLGALGLMGCLVPPLSTIVLSRVGSSATASDAAANDDVWQVDDLRVVLDNLVAAQATRGITWSTWPVRSLPRITGPYPASGPLPAGLDRFL
ncbi:MAG TPA: NAD(P)H-dependent oxidoreductase [Polyangiaceae bacterium]|nr:NAD(P)H-dependent oxidoreductase [Polyangiaceae bacterium]